MGNKSRIDRDERQRAAMQREHEKVTKLASIVGKATMPQGARPPQPGQAPMTIEARLAGTNASIEQLDRMLGKLKQRAEEVEAQLLKALGAREMLEAMQAEQGAQAGAQGPGGRGDTSTPPDAPSPSEADPRDDDEGSGAS